ncbi:amidohydrolase [Mucilaginibacter sp. MD40]|uniref:amidohydrolase family protein n=1 Tax=Mucilaginibacter sp. MD40 TaxID=2029590 RepID=UPI000BAC75D1|nr:amidohydrolase family protein [Mucilaginibacter sp. MD40]PAW92303.1 amidohydrolase [Mucilaginibacter sp. MD40]
MMKNPGSFKVITIEEHFTIGDISARVMMFNKNSGKITPRRAAVQKDLMAIVLPTNDHIEEVAEQRIKFMDEAGVDMQVLSYGGNSPQNITDKDLAIGLCKKTNDTLAELIAANPARFSGFATLPVTDPAAASAELDRSVNELGLRGAMLSGTLEGRFFDAPEFLPVFQKASALGVPVYMHPAIINPAVASYYYQSNSWSDVAAAMFATAGYGWHVDSGIAIIRMIAAGIFDRLPDLQLISGHWGELVPFYLDRLDDQLGKTLTIERRISEYYRSNIHITPAGLFSIPQLQYAIAEIGADRILYAGDYPFLIDRNTRNFILNAPIAHPDKIKIAHTNAERLLKLC